MEKVLKGDISETASQRPSSLSNYSWSWPQWVSWYSEMKVDPFSCDVNQVLNHLSFLFGLLGDMGQLISPIMSILLKTCCSSCKRPHQPLFMFIWDVQIVLKYIKCEWRSYEILLNKFLTLRLLILMSSTSASMAFMTELN